MSLQVCPAFTCEPPALAFETVKVLFEASASSDVPAIILPYESLEESTLDSFTVTLLLEASSAETTPPP